MAMRFRFVFQTVPVARYKWANTCSDGGRGTFKNNILVPLNQNSASSFLRFHHPHMLIMKPWLCSMAVCNQRTARAAYHNKHRIKCLATIAMTENTRNKNSHPLDAPNSKLFFISQMPHETYSSSFFGLRSSAIMKNYSSIVEFNSLGEITTTETGMCGSRAQHFKWGDWNFKRNLHFQVEK